MCAAPRVHSTPTRIQKMTEKFLNTPLGQQEVGVSAYLRQKDPDAMMLNLGMTLAEPSDTATLLAPGQQPASPTLLQEGAPATAEDGSLAGSPSDAREETPFSELSKPLFEPGSPSMPTVPLSKHAGGTSDFSFLIRTLAAHGRFGEARTRVVPEMKRRGLRLDGRTYSALLAGAARNRDPAAAEEVGGPGEGVEYADACFAGG